MTQESREFKTDLAIIGSGLAGMAASIFALNRNIPTAQAGNTGAIAYTTGYLDLLGNTVNGKAMMIDDPWAGISKLRIENPKHPLARVADQDIRNSFNEFTAFLGECGIVYGSCGDVNLQALTPAGTAKPTMSVPATMQAGVQAYQEKAKCLIVDFKGLRGFSGRQVVSNLIAGWPALRTERVTFPDMTSGEIYPEVMARALEVPANRELLAETILKVKGDAEYIGMPAIMGMHNPDQVLAELSRLIGCPLFEIPTMPPSVPGIRLREMFEQVFPKKGLTLVPQQKVKSVSFDHDRVHLSLTDNFGPILIKAKAVILATGRFLSGGLEAEHNGIREPLLDLDIAQPASRNDWYSTSYMDKQGHAIHKCGIEVDAHFRPVDNTGEVVDPRLFAAGVILAHQDWIRGRCGAGVAIATAYRAVLGAQAVIAGNKLD